MIRPEPGENALVGFSFKLPVGLPTWARLYRQSLCEGGAFKRSRHTHDSPSCRDQRLGRLGCATHKAEAEEDAEYVGRTPVSCMTCQLAT